jgi:FlaA1/EpsC-like NDP-sugar epimerase
VVPIFRRQIALGGPLTVTDRRMTRYFMTIPEAVQLVIRSGSLGTGGEIFVLEMGEPVSIWQLAETMIELSGLRPGEDIAIEEVGRRPGEKLHEELFNPYERTQPTPAEKILHAERDRLDTDTVETMFDEVGLLVLEGDAAALAAKVAELTAMRAAAVPDGGAAGTGWAGAQRGGDADDAGAAGTGWAGAERGSDADDSGAAGTGRAVL